MTKHEPRGKKIGIMHYASIEADRDVGIPTELYVEGVNSKDSPIYLEIQLSDDRLARMDQFACVISGLRKVFKEAKAQIIRDIEYLEGWMQR